MSAESPGNNRPPLTESCTAILEAADLDCSEAVAPGPATALRLTVRLAPGADPDAYVREFVDLLHSLHDYDLALGGSGLMLDHSRSGASNGSLSVVLYPLDIRWSRDRFAEMAVLLGERPGPLGEEVTGPAENGDRIAEVISRYEGRSQFAAESPRDRVARWKNSGTWMAGLQVRFVRPPRAR